MKFIANLLVNSLAVYITASLLPGVVLSGFWTAIVVAFILGIVNAIIKPFLVILTLPLTLITLGLFSFIINALMILLVDYLVVGFQVNGFISALIFSFVLSLASFILHLFIK